MSTALPVRKCVGWLHTAAHWPVNRMWIYTAYSLTQQTDRISCLGDTFYILRLLNCDRIITGLNIGEIVCSKQQLML